MRGGKLFAIIFVNNRSQAQLSEMKSHLYVSETLLRVVKYQKRSHVQKRVLYMGSFSLPYISIIDLVNRF